MHDIEPYYNWRDHYISSEDDKSPFYQRTYSEFTFTNKVYNYFIHPQWDDFGSSTLYMKILFVDYDEKYAIIELIGEWNDAINNDIMFLKRNIIDLMTDHEIVNFVLLCENVLNFHGSDDCYYEEWFQDIMEMNGWIAFVNLLDHVQEEMINTSIDRYVNFGDHLNTIKWRPQKPKSLIINIVNEMASNQKRLD